MCVGAYSIQVCFTSGRGGTASNFGPSWPRPRQTTSDNKTAQRDHNIHGRSRTARCGEGESVEAHDPTHSALLSRSAPEAAAVERYPVPDRITLEDGARVRKEMRGMVQGDIDTPTRRISSRTRRGIARASTPGTGPGMYYALCWRCCSSRGIKCFSGLCVAGGVNWKVFLDKLGGRSARCKRLFVVQTDALYNSRPCLQEIYTAVSRKLRVLPVLFEKTPLLSRPKDQWPQLTVDDSEGKGWLLDVQRIFGALNSLPSPPATAVEQPAALLDALNHIAAEGADSTAEP